MNDSVRLRAAERKRTKTCQRVLSGPDLENALRAQCALTEIAELRAALFRELAAASETLNVRYAGPIMAAEKRRDAAIEALGLTEAGTIKIDAAAQPPMITYEVPDDGKGDENGADVGQK